MSTYIIKIHSIKAFGRGQVIGIDGAQIGVSFNGELNLFQFPGAFEQGFLKIVE